MAIKTFHSNEAVNEGTDAQYECVFIEAAPDQPQLVAAAILTIEATLKGGVPEVIINSRDEQNVKGANGGSLASDGLFVLQLGALDNIIVTNPVGARGVEDHRLTLAVTYSRTGGGEGTLHHEVRFSVLGLADVS